MGGALAWKGTPPTLKGTPPGSYRRLERHAALVPGAITAEREGEGEVGERGGALAEESRPVCSSRG